MSSSEIDMSCKLFGLLLGFVALLMVLVGLPAFLVSMEASTTVCVCHDNTDFYSASTTSDTVVRAQLLAAAPSSGKRADMRTFTGLVTDTFKVAREGTAQLFVSQLLVGRAAWRRIGR
jgi:hypothetical protein